MLQLLLSIDFLNKRDLIHRDLKIDNILINKISAEGDYYVKIADFGLATALPKDGSFLYEVCGTPTYIAPEALRDQGYREKWDVFSLGSIMFNLLTGRSLFNGANNEEMMKKNKECEFPNVSRYLEKYSKEAQDLLFKMIEANPDRRISTEQALQHPWFAESAQVINDLIRVNDHICTRYLRGINNLKKS